MEKNRTVFFDFDGVICDSFAAAHGTAKTYCVHNTEEKYRGYFEDNIYRSEMATKDLDHSQCKHDLDWWNTFKSLFSENEALFAQMDDVVRRLAENYRLIIVSSSTHEVISSFLKTHKLDSCFEEIMDADMHTSKSHKIGIAFEKYGITPKTSIMVTDSKGDILEAREKGVESIAFTWGFNSYDVLLSGDPFRIVHVPHELPNAVTEFFHGKGTAA
jgi:HAD superfamily hydrolase (TIGR01549 family)